MITINAKYEAKTSGSIIQELQRQFAILMTYANYIPACVQTLLAGKRQSCALGRRTNVYMSRHHQPHTKRRDAPLFCQPVMSAPMRDVQFTYYMGRVNCLHAPGHCLNAPLKCSSRNFHFLHKEVLYQWKTVLPFRMKCQAFMFRLQIPTPQ